MRPYIQLFGIFEKFRLWQASLHKPISPLQALWPIEISRFWEGVGVRFPQPTRLWHFPGGGDNCLKWHINSFLSPRWSEKKRQPGPEPRLPFLTPLLRLLRGRWNVFKGDGVKTRKGLKIAGPGQGDILVGKRFARHFSCEGASAIGSHYNKIA